MDGERIDGRKVPVIVPNHLVALKVPAFDLHLRGKCSIYGAESCGQNACGRSKGQQVLVAGERLVPPHRTLAVCGSQESNTAFLGPRPLRLATLSRPRSFHTWR